LPDEASRLLRQAGTKCQQQDKGGNPTYIGNRPAGPPRIRNLMRNTNEPPAGGITAWIDYGSRTEKATFYGTIVAIGSLAGGR
jgi:hypothetical protein